MSQLESCSKQIRTYSCTLLEQVILKCIRIYLVVIYSSNSLPVHVCLFINSPLRINIYSGVKEDYAFGYYSFAWSFARRIYLVDMAKMPLAVVFISCCITANSDGEEMIFFFILLKEYRYGFLI